MGNREVSILVAGHCPEQSDSGWSYSLGGWHYQHSYLACLTTLSPIGRWPYSEENTMNYNRSAWPQKSLMFLHKSWVYFGLSSLSWLEIDLEYSFWEIPGIVTKYVGVVLQILRVGVCWCIVMLMCLIFPPRIQKDIPLREVNSQALDLLLFTSNPASIVVCTPQKHGTSK